MPIQTSLRMTDYVPDIAPTSGWNMIRHIDSVQNEKQYEIDTAALIRQPYQYAFDTISSYWIAFDDNYISMGVNEVTPANSIITQKLPRPLPLPLTHLGVWSLGTNQDDTRIEHTIEPLPDEVSLATFFTSQPPLGLSKDPQTGKTTLFGGYHTMIEPGTGEWKPLLKTSESDAFFIEFDPQQLDLSSSVYFSLYAASDAKKFPSTTDGKDFISMGGSSRGISLNAIYSATNARDNLITNPLTSPTAPLRLSLEGGRIRLERKINGTWQHEPFKEALNIVSNQIVSRTTASIPNPYQLSSPIQTAQYLWLTTNSLMEFNRFQYTGMTLHDQVLTPNNTGEYLWNTALIAPKKDHIQLQGTLLHTVTSETICSATLGFAPLN